MPVEFQDVHGRTHCEDPETLLFTCSEANEQIADGEFALIARYTVTPFLVSSVRFFPAVWPSFEVDRETFARLAELKRTRQRI